MTTCVVNFVFLPSHSSKVLSGDGLVGGNPNELFQGVIMRLCLQQR